MDDHKLGNDAPMTPARRLGEVLGGVERAKGSKGYRVSKWLMNELRAGKFKDWPVHLDGNDIMCSKTDRPICTPVFATSAERDRWRERVGGSDDDED